MKVGGVSDHMHYGDVIVANSAPGPGRGPAPTAGAARWWWRRWALFDALLLDTLDALDPETYVTLLQRWPNGWPTVESGLLSIRQMEWMRCRVSGMPFDPVARLMVGAA